MRPQLQRINVYPHLLEVMLVHYGMQEYAGLPQGIRGTQWITVRRIDRLCDKNKFPESDTAPLISEFEIPDSF
jgi:hypothetical protein